MTETAGLQSNFKFKAKLPAESCAALASVLSKAMPAQTTPPDISLIASVLLLANLDYAPLLAFTGGTARLTVHEYQSFCFSAPLQTGQDYSVSANPSAASKAKAAFGFESRILDSSGQVCLETRTILRHLDRSEICRLNGPALPALVQQDPIDWVETRPISQSLVNRYLTLSRDGNRVHNDTEFARSVGLEGVIIPGMVLIGLLDFILARQFFPYCCTDLKVRFMSPVSVGAKVRLGLQPRGFNGKGDIRLRAYATTTAGAVAMIADLVLDAMHASPRST